MDDSFPLGNGKVTVAAVITGADADRVNGGNFIVGPLPLIQRLTDRVGMIDSILIVAAPGADLAQVRADVTAAVNGRAIVAEPAFRSAQSGGAVATLRILMLSAASAALVVAGFLIYNAMSMAIAQRRPSISMLRAIGANKRQIVGDLLMEAGLVGLVGGVLGIGARSGHRQALDRCPARGGIAGVRIANRIHLARLRNSYRRGRLYRHERSGGGAGGPAGVQGAAGRSPGPRRRVRCRSSRVLRREWQWDSSVLASSQRRSCSQPATWEGFPWRRSGL